MMTNGVATSFMFMGTGLLKETKALCGPSIDDGIVCTLDFTHGFYLAMRSNHHCTRRGQGTYVGFAQGGDV